MSKVKITGNASGTGVFTIEAPGTNDPRTLTLPDSTGTLLDENSSLPSANLTGSIAGARLPDPLPAISGANLTSLPASVASYVQFPATQVNSTDANRLDEYEEGTWTISLTCGSGTATISSTYSTAGYIRIGREVFIHGFPYVTGVSSPSSTLDVYGLPFAAGYNLGNTCHLPFNINSTIANSPIPSGVSAYIWEGNSYMRVVLNGSNSSNNTAQYLAVGSYIYLGGSYYTSST